MKTIKIKHRFIGNTIFSYTCEGNSTRTTLLEALDNDTNLSYADLRGANLSGANGIKYSQVSFSGFGESNRLISLIEIDNELIFFCGCFSGNKESLEKYISDGDKEYKKSRILAMETLMTLINN